MIIKLSYLTLAAIALIGFSAKADDIAWGATNGGSLVLANFTTGQLVSVSYHDKPYTNFVILNSANNNRLGSSLTLAKNGSVLYGLDNSGTLYTIDTSQLVQGVNSGDVGFTATKVTSIAVNNIQGAVFISPNLLDISAGGNSLYQYDFTTQTGKSLGSFANNVYISGLAYTTSLYGVQYSSSPGMIDPISGTTLAKPLANSSFQGASGQSSMFAGSSLLYVTDGNNGIYSYNLANNTLTPVIGNNFPNLRSLAPQGSDDDNEDEGEGGDGTPTPTATPSPTPTATVTPAAFSLPTGALTVTAPETTPTGYPECAASYGYSAKESSMFAEESKIDPQGTLGIYRYVESTTTGVYVIPAPVYYPGQNPSKFVPTSSVWTWSSGSSNSHAAINYIAAQDSNGVQLGDVYGREILELVYTLGNGAQYVLDSKAIYLYPWYPGLSSGPSAVLTNTLAKTALAAGNPSPYASPYPTPSPSIQGDLPRVTVQMNNLYPSGTSWVIMYPGNPVANPTASPIPSTTQTAPSGGLWTIISGAGPAAVTFELAPYVTGAQTYTIQALQQLPAAYYAKIGTAPFLNPSIINTVTFSWTGFSVNGTVGTVK